MQRFLLRSVWLPAAIFGALMLIFLALLLGFLWRSMQRLEPVYAHRVLIERMTQETLFLGDVLFEAAQTGTPPSAEVLEQTIAAFAQLQAIDGYLAGETAERLQALVQALAAGRAGHPLDTARIRKLRRALVLDEFRAHQQLIAEAYRDAQAEFKVVTATMVVLLLLAGLLLLLLRRRITQPLRNLRLLMTALARRDYREAPTHGVDPLLLPLFENYNRLTQRLAELERARERRQQSLEQEVRAATTALLEQQRDLANAERLAAMGEVAAGLAHELRNPLAGIQMSLS
ncbi:MAG: two-component sensor histidine kinase, partial [Anaerolineae bacterium]|nr:two-component sensor histidine kinase [Anaerolineae bacterium]